MCVCDPQRVRTAAAYRGARGSLMSKMRMPSQFSSVSGTRDASHESSDMVSSIDTMTRLPTALTSPCPPGHETALTSSGAAGSAMSQMENPA